ncbi:PEP/pyruvate-binding domain-containing protein, partial [Myxococcota bacterium]|nr:PEP/pyruvate-binding domain-containing protein [Myxococcota bacterium]
YQSESACAADELDGDTAGPSLCDPDTNKERSLSAALGEVFASVWATEAWEEREWYGIDHLQAEMAVLVNTRSKDEQANIVAFTGNPNDIEDDRLLVNAQLGAWDVVSAEPGVVPEKVYLTVSDGVVTKIERVSPSSQVESGEVVLTDAQLEALGAALVEITEVMPLDHSPAAGHDVVWDTEWKVLEDGRLVVKQIRPFQR